MNLPIPKPPAGNHPLAAWCRSVVRCLEMLRPSAGIGTKTSVTTHGTIISSKPQRDDSGGGDARWS